MACNLGVRSRFPKHLLGLNLVGVWFRGASPKFLDPMYISITIESNDFKFGIGHMGSSLSRTTVRTKIGGGLG